MKSDPKLKKINSLFDKYKKQLKAPESSVIKEVCEVIKDLTYLDIDKNQVTYNVATKVVTLKIPSVLKQEILLHQKDILLHLKGRLGDKSAPGRIQ